MVNEKKFQSIHGPLFEEFFFAARQDIYNIMCVLHDYGKHKYNSTGATYFHVGRPLPEYSSVNFLASIFVTIKFIDTQINTLEKNIAWNCLASQDKMREIFNINPTKVKKLLNISREKSNFFDWYWWDVVL